MTTTLLRPVQRLSFLYSRDREDHARNASTCAIFPKGRVVYSPKPEKGVIDASAPRCTATINHGCTGYQAPCSGRLSVACPKCGISWTGFTSSHEDAVREVNLICGGGE